MTANFLLNINFRSHNFLRTVKTDYLQSDLKWEIRQFTSDARNDFESNCDYATRTFFGKKKKKKKNNPNPTNNLRYFFVCYSRKGISVTQSQNQTKNNLKKNIFRIFAEDKKSKQIIH